MAETENPKKPEKYIQLVESDFKGSRAKAKRSKPREVVYTLPEPEIRPTRPEGPKATEAIVEQVLRSIVAECSDPDRFSRASLLEKDKYPSECLDLLEEQDRERWPARGVPQSKIVGLVVEGLWQRGFREPWADNGAGWEYIRPMLEKGGFAEYVTGEGAKYKRCNDIIDWDPAWRWVGEIDSLPALEGMHLKILKHLANTAGLVKEVDLASAVDKVERTVRPFLRQLETANVIHRPNGAKRGYQIVPERLAAVRDALSKLR